MPRKLARSPQVMPLERIERRILLVRGHKVMLDRDLAALYQVKPIALRQAVKRNSNRFPEDFVLQLNGEEAEALVSQTVIPSRRSLGGFLPLRFHRTGRRHAFECFAERTRRCGKRRHHAHLYAATSVARHAHRTCRASCRVGGKMRSPLPGRVRHPEETHGAPAGTAKASNRVHPSETVPRPRFAFADQYK
jgi:hypothetical protein